MIAAADLSADRLSAAMPLSPRSLDFGSAPIAGRGVFEASTELPQIVATSIADTWSRIAEESLTEDRCSWAWATPSTLVAAAPGAVTFDALARQTEAEARDRGAVCPAPIHPARENDGVLFTHYRRWFRPASELDAGRLHVTAFFNPAVALRAVLGVLPAKMAYAYEDASHTLIVSSADLRAAVDAELVSFLSLMHGLAPEQGLAMALAEASRRLDRLAQLRDVTNAVVAVTDVQFIGDTPSWRTARGVIVDPPGGRYVASTESHPDRSAALERALSPGMSTPCTCDAPRTVRPILRPRSDVYSFSSEADAQEPLFQPVGRGHCRIYEVSCPHASRRPSAEEWRGMGWTAERCEQDWKAHVLDAEEVMFTATSGWLTRAVLLYGREIGAVAPMPEVASGLARRCGFEPPTLVTVYVPTANLLFITDEAIDDERILRRALEQGPLLTIVLDSYALPPGVNVDYCATLRVLDRPALAVRMQRLDLHPPRAGGNP